MFALLWPAMQRTGSTTFSGSYDDELERKHDMHNMGPWQR